VVVCAGVVVVVGVVAVVVGVGVVAVVGAVVAVVVVLGAGVDCWVTTVWTTGVAVVDSGAVMTRSARAASSRLARR
jgi:hypothetical protein